MIASIAGEIIGVGEDNLTIDINGVGFQVSVPKSMCLEHKPGERIFLHTHLVVREDLLALYGFPTSEEKSFFLMLLGVEGIGPRIALATLSSLTTDAIRRAVLSEQPEIFSRVPGIGKKTAQKILIQLQGQVHGTAEMLTSRGFDELDTQVIEALTVLGYSLVEAQTAIQTLPKDASENLEERLRLALQYFNA